MNASSSLAARAGNLRRRSGAFSPFNYSIGLASDLDTLLAFAADIEYPLPDSAPTEHVSQFSEVLTLFHESVHLGQFLSTSFGLRTLRFTLIAVRYLAQLNHLHPPILDRLLHKKRLNEVENQAFYRFLFLLDTLDQFRIDVEKLGESGAAAASFSIEMQPWSPGIRLAAEAGRKSAARALKQMSFPVNHLPTLIFRTGTSAHRLTLNAAALMEAFALLAEFNQILNAFGPEGLATFRDYPLGGEYVGAINYLINTIQEPADFLGIAAICIDVAMMYDTFVLYEVPQLGRQGRPRLGYPYPGETFVRACEAAKGIPRFGPDDREGSARFYRDLCAAMKLPSPAWMAERAYETAQSILSSAAGLENTLLGKAVQMHVEALDLRRKSPENFPLDLQTRTGVGRILDIAVPHVSLYQLGTRRVNRIKPGTLDLAVCYSIIQQILTADAVECPLKQGEPFFCPASAAEPDQYCSFREGDREYDCPREWLVKLLGSEG